MINGRTNTLVETDREVSHRVRLTLGRSHHPAFHSLNVDEVDGAIVLSGNVPSFYLKQVVQTIAGSVDGVRKLDNRVEVIRPSAVTA